MATTVHALATQLATSSTELTEMIRAILLNDTVWQTAFKATNATNPQLLSFTIPTDAVKLPHSTDIDDTTVIHTNDIAVNFFAFVVSFVSAFGTATLFTSETQATVSACSLNTDEQLALLYNITAVCAINMDTTFPMIVTRKREDYTVVLENSRILYSQSLRNVILLEQENMLMRAWDIVTSIAKQDEVVPFATLRVILRDYQWSIHNSQIFLKNVNGIPILCISN